MNPLLEGLQAIPTHTLLEDKPVEPLFSREKIDEILSIVPPEGRCCYTGQSILAYCPDPTFDWAEVNAWPDETDVDLFCYSMASLSSLVQRFTDHGWEPASSLDKFKSERIRFWDPPKRFPLQTVALTKHGMPAVNLTWKNHAEDILTTLRAFDMDYLMVGMDVRTKNFVDLRGPNHRIAGVNKLNAKFDVADVESMFWLRQFDRIPKGYARGIDTRPVARTYLGWLEETIARGDKGVGSKTRFYADRQMQSCITTLVGTGIEQRQAEAIYHLARREDNTWEAMLHTYTSMHKTITEWLTSVEDD